jgi:methionyl-tRNA synthetase
VLGLLNKHFDTLPEPSGQAEMIDDEIKQMAKMTTERLDGLMDQISLDMALETIWEFVRRINRYIQETKAWSLKDQKVRMGTILYNAMESLRVISVYLTPFMPQVAAKIQTQIGVDPNLQDLKSVEKWGGLDSGLPIAKTASLFPRKESKKSEPTELVSLPAKETIQKSTDNLITIEQVKNLELRVCQVVSAEKSANSDRLLKLQVDLGKEKRQVVAGIAPTYTPESVIGKQVVLVANLQATKIRGVESQGMLLAAVRKKDLSLLTMDQAIKNGTRIS